MKTRGSATVAVYVVIGLVGLALWVFKPKVFSGDSRRASASTEATAKVEATTTKQSAEAAASVVKINEVVSTLPESLEKSFVLQETPVALAKLPPPDAQALIAAEKRKVAVLQGQIEEAHKLYDAALKRADVLAQEKADAIAERREVDLKLQQVAAERLGAERTRNIFIAVAALASILFIYYKFTRPSPSAIAEAVNDIKAGANPITALDGITTRMQQKLVSWIAHIKSKV